MSVKLRQIRNSFVLPIPNTIHPKATEFNVFQGVDGTIIYQPVVPNPFHNKAFTKTHKFTQSEKFYRKLIGHELPIH